MTRRPADRALAVPEVSHRWIEPATRNIQSRFGRWLLRLGFQRTALLVAAAVAILSIFTIAATFPTPCFVPWPAIWHASYDERIGIGQLLIAGYTSVGLLVAVLPKLLIPHEMRFAFVFLDNEDGERLTYFLYVRNNRGRIHHFRIEAVISPRLDTTTVTPGVSSDPWQREDDRVNGPIASLAWNLESENMFPGQVRVLVFHVEKAGLQPSGIKLVWWMDDSKRYERLVTAERLSDFSKLRHQLDPDHQQAARPPV